MFLGISAECPSRFFVKFVAGLATKWPVKDKFGSRKGGFNWTKKRWRRTSLVIDDRLNDLAMSAGRQLVEDSANAEKDTATAASEIVFTVPQKPPYQRVTGVKASVSL